MSDATKDKDGPATTWWAERSNPANRGRGNDYKTRGEAARECRRADGLFPLYRHWHTPYAAETQESAPPPPMPGERRDDRREQRPYARREDRRTAGHHYR